MYICVFYNLLFNGAHENDVHQHPQMINPALAVYAAWNFCHYCTVRVDYTTTELASGPHTLKFESPPPALEPVLPIDDEPRMSDNNGAVSPLRAVLDEQDMEISTIPRWPTGFIISLQLAFCLVWGRLYTKIAFIR